MDGLIEGPQRTMPNIAFDVVRRRRRLAKRDLSCACQRRDRRDHVCLASEVSEVHPSGIEVDAVDVE